MLQLLAGSCFCFCAGDRPGPQREGEKLFGKRWKQSWLLVTVELLEPVPTHGLDPQSVGETNLAHRSYFAYPDTEFPYYIHLC